MTPANSAYTPASLEAVQGHILDAGKAGESLEVVGSGSKRNYGRPVEAAHTLSLAGLNGIVDYQPHELILVARPATPLAELEATLSAAGQMLAFEPPHWGEGATLGGAIGCNLSGPRRIKAGAARDHLLGFQAVTGTGDVIRNGGRVVKNVTGYDLSKLMCGSFGTLAVLTEVIVKVLPRPETEQTLLVSGLSEAAGVAQMIAATRTSHEVSGLAHLPAGLETPSSITVAGAVAGAGLGTGAVTALRLEGPEPSVRHRLEALKDLFSGPGGGDVAVLEREASRDFWVSVRELAPLARQAETRLWRFSVPPTQGAALGQALRDQGAERLFYDWGGGLLWACLAPHVKAETLLALAAEKGGHGQRVRDAEGERSADPVFGALSPGQYRLNLNLKMAFDPKRVLNPGKMHPEI